MGPVSRGCGGLNRGTQTMCWAQSPAHGALALSVGCTHALPCLEPHLASFTVILVSAETSPAQRLNSPAAAFMMPIRFTTKSATPAPSPGCGPHEGEHPVSPFYSYASGTLWVLRLLSWEYLQGTCVTWIWHCQPLPVGACQGQGVLKGQDGQEASISAWHPFSGTPRAAPIPPGTGLSLLLELD